MSSCFFFKQMKVENLETFAITKSLKIGNLILWKERKKEKNKKNIKIEQLKLGIVREC